MKQKIDSKSSIYFGDSQILGCGLARTFSIFKKDCLSKVGFVINEKAFQSLPTFTNSCVQSYKLALPFSEKVQELGIKFGEIDWHPLGQTQYASLGNGLLAFRLFFIDAFQTQQIVPLGPNCDTFVSNDPRLATPSTVLPTGFVPFPVATSVVESTTEEIGIRYLASSSIVPNAPFQQTLFFGVWNQSLTFLEPIVKKDQILNHKCEPFVSTIPQPSVLPHCKTFPVAWEYGYSDCLGGFYVVFHFE